MNELWLIFDLINRGAAPFSFYNGLAYIKPEALIIEGAMRTAAVQHQ